MKGTIRTGDKHCKFLSEQAITVTLSLLVQLFVSKCHPKPHFPRHFLIKNRMARPLKQGG